MLVNKKNTTNKLNSNHCAAKLLSHHREAGQHMEVVSRAQRRGTEAGHRGGAQRQGSIWKWLAGHRGGAQRRGTEAGHRGRAAYGSG